LRVYDVTPALPVRTSMEVVPLKVNVWPSLTTRPPLPVVFDTAPSTHTLSHARPPETSTTRFTPR